MNQVVQPNTSRIKRLDHRLANQIAAGEVVERPASVVKELLENAIDSGATRIEVDVERGGTRLIRVTDNGSGIVKDDLTLALSRHATSKLSCSKDLEQIHSLGFRGEALASIASVSHLCLSSRTEGAEFAWQAIAEGRDMQVQVQPASATVGTRVEVRELFFNTPARKKFLRAEKTEFSHIEEIFKCHALVNLGIAFILKHNGKVVKRVPAGSQSNEYLKRVEIICGKPFADNAIPFCCHHEVIKIDGWLGGGNYHRSESDIQYVFVNGRPVKDRTLSHAIRQSYQGILPAGRMPAYVIFLNLASDKIDVNVHPTKHEVRFDEQRLVHDILAKSVDDCLAENVNDQYTPPLLDLEDSNKEQQANHSAGFSSSWRKQQPATGFSTQAVYQKAQQSNAGSQVGDSLPQSDIAAIYADSYSAELRGSAKMPGTHQQSELVLGKKRFTNGLWMVLKNSEVLVVDEKKLLTHYLYALIRNGKNSQEDDSRRDLMFAESRPLLFPQIVGINFSFLEECQSLHLLSFLGFIFEPQDNNQILLQQIPQWLDAVAQPIIFENIEGWFKLIIEFSKNSDKAIADIQKGNYLDRELAGIDAIYQQIAPLNSKLLDFLIEQNDHHQFANHAIKNIDADRIKILFEDEQSG